MEDISNIRVTEKNNDFLKRLVDEQGLFETDKMAAIFAISYALKRSLDDSISETYALDPNSINKWDAASIDSTGVLRLIVKERHPSVTCPFRFLQALMNKGLEEMAKNVPSTGFIRISSLM